MKYGIVKAGQAFLYETKEAAVELETAQEKRDEGGVADEVFCGWTVRILEESKKILYVRTFYGYEGYLPKKAVRRCRRKELQAYYTGASQGESGTAFYMVTDAFADVQALPKVQGRILLTAPRGSLLAACGEEETGVQESAAGLSAQEQGTAADAVQSQETVTDAVQSGTIFDTGSTETAENRAAGADTSAYLRVCLPDGRSGYVAASRVRRAVVPAAFTEALLFAKKKKDEDGAVRQRKSQGQGISACAAARQSASAAQKQGVPACLVTEEKLRGRIVEAARQYLGAQYRWGGKSPAGIDCSGLAFMSYFLNGILIYRDAHIMEDYPIRQIPREQLAAGDLIFFPGHVAVSLGGDRFLHSTGHAGEQGVVCGSLREGEQGYRADLRDAVTACGSLFGK